MNTFFISPLIPLGFYIIIQKEKNNPVFNWNKDEIDILNIVNCYNKDRNIILNKKKFNNDDIIKFKYFYKKYKNKQSENKN